jgi:hypothetical protein
MLAVVATAPEPSRLGAAVERRATPAPDLADRSPIESPSTQSARRRRAPGSKGRRARRRWPVSRRPTEASLRPAREGPRLGVPVAAGAIERALSAAWERDSVGSSGTTARTPATPRARLVAVRRRPLGQGRVDRSGPEMDTSSPSRRRCRRSELPSPQARRPCAGSSARELTRAAPPADTRSVLDLEGEGVGVDEVEFRPPRRSLPRESIALTSVAIKKSKTSKFSAIRLGRTDRAVAVLNVPAEVTRAGVSLR